MSTTSNPLRRTVLFFLSLGLVFAASSASARCWICGWDYWEGEPSCNSASFHNPDAYQECRIQQLATMKVCWTYGGLCGGILPVTPDKLWETFLLDAEALDKIARHDRLVSEILRSAAEPADPLGLSLALTPGARSGIISDLRSGQTFDVELQLTLDNEGVLHLELELQNRSGSGELRRLTGTLEDEGHRIRWIDDTSRLWQLPSAKVDASQPSP